MIKLGIYTKHLDELGLTGPNVYQTNLIKHLSKRNDVDLFLIHHKRTANSPFYSSENNILIPKTPLIGELASRKYDLDIIHFNYIPWEYRILFFTLKQKKVATAHISIGWNGQNNWEAHNLIRKFVEPLSAKFLDKIIAVSEDLKARLVRYLHVPQSKIEVIHEGIDDSVFKPIKNNELLTEVRDRYEIRKPFILHVSNFSMRKNPRILFQTFKHLVRGGFRGELLITGSGWRNPISEELVTNLRIHNVVKFAGYVPITDLARLFNLAEIAFFPSLHENFGLPIVEAMACGTPVVASRVYSIPEIAGNAAILCKPKDAKGFSVAIKTILEDEGLRGKMKKMGYENSKRFSWHKCVKETIEVYKSILS